MIQKDNKLFISATENNNLTSSMNTFTKTNWSNDCINNMIGMIKLKEVLDESLMVEVVSENSECDHVYEKNDNSETCSKCFLIDDSENVVQAGCGTRRFPVIKDYEVREILEVTEFRDVCLQELPSNNTIPMEIIQCAIDITTKITKDVVVKGNNPFKLYTYIIMELCLQHNINISNIQLSKELGFKTANTMKSSWIYNGHQIYMNYAYRHGYTNSNHINQLTKLIDTIRHKEIDNDLVILRNIETTNHLLINRTEEMKSNILENVMFFIRSSQCVKSTHIKKNYTCWTCFIPFVKQHKLEEGFILKLIKEIVCLSSELTMFSDQIENTLAEYKENFDLKDVNVHKLAKLKLKQLEEKENIIPITINQVEYNIEETISKQHRISKKRINVSSKPIEPVECIEHQEIQ